MFHPGVWQRLRQISSRILLLSILSPLQRKCIFRPETRARRKSRYRSASDAVVAWWTPELFLISRACFIHGVDVGVGSCACDRGSRTPFEFNTWSVLLFVLFRFCEKMILFPAGRKIANQKRRRHGTHSQWPPVRRAKSIIFGRYFISFDIKSAIITRAVRSVLFEI